MVEAVRVDARSIVQPYSALPAVISSKPLVVAAAVGGLVIG